MKSKFALPVVMGLVVIAFLFLFLAPRRQGEDKSALLKALTKSKLSLAEGIKKAVKSPEAAISAKFELDEKGALSISVYTAEKGLDVSADQNVLNEISANAENDTWDPKSEVIKDSSDLSYAK